MKNKLKQKKGETLVETLFSLMIAVLSIGLIATAVTAANSVSAQIKEIDVKYKQELQAAECYEGTSQSEVLRLTFYDSYAGTELDNKTVLVEVYGQADSAFISYDYEAGVSGP